MVAGTVKLLPFEGAVRTTEGARFAMPSEAVIDLLCEVTVKPPLSMAFAVIK